MLELWIEPWSAIYGVGYGAVPGSLAIGRPSAPGDSVRRSRL